MIMKMNEREAVENLLDGLMSGIIPITMTIVPDERCKTVCDSYVERMIKPNISSYEDAAYCLKLIRDKKLEISCINLDMYSDSIFNEIEIKLSEILQKYTNKKFDTNLDKLEADMFFKLNRAAYYNCRITDKTFFNQIIYIINNSINNMIFSLEFEDKFDKILSVLENIINHYSKTFALTKKQYNLRKEKLYELSLSRQSEDFRKIMLMNILINAKSLFKDTYKIYLLNYSDDLPTASDLVKNILNDLNYDSIPVYVLEDFSNSLAFSIGRILADTSEIQYIKDLLAQFEFKKDHIDNDQFNRIFSLFPDQKHLALCTIQNAFNYVIAQLKDKLEYYSKKELPIFKFPEYEDPEKKVLAYDIEDKMWFDRRIDKNSKITPIKYILNYPDGREIEYSGSMLYLGGWNFIPDPKTPKNDMEDVLKVLDKFSNKQYDETACSYVIIVNVNL